MLPRPIRSFLTSALLLGLLVPSLPAFAEEAQRVPAVTRSAAKEESAEHHDEATGNAEQSATKAGDEKNQQGDSSEGSDAPERELTPEEKDAAIEESDDVIAFDAAKIRGMAKPWQHYFQPAATPMMQKLEGLHDLVFIIICVMTLLVTALLIYVMVRFRAAKNPVPHRFAHNTVIEIAWTVIPVIILVIIGIPSVRAHYKYVENEDIINNPDLTLKVVGHQWYWSYEYPDYGIAYDSNIVAEKDLKDGQPRLLTVDNPVVVPAGKVVRVQITSADVMHDWAMPSFAIKQDAVPGRLNQSWFKVEEEGIYYGQCSELCGKYHGFMPIEVHVVSPTMFDAWVAGAKLKYAQTNHLQFALNQ